MLGARPARVPRKPASEFTVLPDVDCPARRVRKADLYRPVERRGRELSPLRHTLLICVVHQSILTDRLPPAWLARASTYFERSHAPTPGGYQLIR
jgi:hypothetical protein